MQTNICSQDVTCGLFATLGFIAGLSLPHDISCVSKFHESSRVLIARDRSATPMRGQYGIACPHLRLVADTRQFSSSLVHLNVLSHLHFSALPIIQERNANV